MVDSMVDQKVVQRVDYWVVSMAVSWERQRVDWMAVQTVDNLVVH